MSPEKVPTARRMYESKEFTSEAIARVLDVSRAPIYRHLADGQSADSAPNMPPSRLACSAGRRNRAPSG